MQTTAVDVLRDGEALTREAFERCYEALSDVRAELIEGIVQAAG